MTPERMRVKLAEWEGWKEENPAPAFTRWEGWATWKSPEGKWLMNPPDYPNDLNAVRELERGLTDAEWKHYYRNLTHAIASRAEAFEVPADTYYIHASALARCEALCQTLGIEEKS